jgi:hypothetical protein
MSFEVGGKYNFWHSPAIIAVLATRPDALGISSATQNHPGAAR